jgi:hypothetical protein
MTTSKTFDSANPPRRGLRVVLIAGLVLGSQAVFFVGLWYALIRPATLLERLLAGDSTVEVSSLVFSGQQQQVVVDDPESVRYLTAAFRSAGPKAYVAGHCGTTYTMDVRFTGWCSFRAGCYVPQEENGLTVCPNWHTLILDDPYFHWVAFPEPVPERVKEAIRKLRNPPVGR